MPGPSPGARSRLLAPHLHVAVGRKDLEASGSVSHLLRAEVQFIQGMALQEVIAPSTLRPRCGPHSVPTLTFEPSSLKVPPS